MKRIGIITLRLKYNFGGILQAYALQTVLKNMGYQVCLIEKKDNKPIWKMPYLYVKRILMNIKGYSCPIFLEQKTRREEAITLQNTNRFIHKYINRRIVNKYSELDKNDYDAVIVGSDQVWRLLYVGKLEIRSSYLSFTRGWNIKRIAYAASFGTDNWEYPKLLTLMCKKLVSRFDAVSVRESSAIELCKTHFNIEAQQVIDPTMLLNQDEYIKLIQESGIKESNGSLLVYILDEQPEITELVNVIAKERELIPFCLNSRIENQNAPLNERIQPPVEEWLRGFYDAEFIVTDSFHACVFSILFKKPFIVYANKDRGLTRIVSLLKMFGLENQLITSMAVFDKNRYKDIAWGNVFRILNMQRNKAMDFLFSTLK